MKGEIPKPPTTKINVRTVVMPDEKGQQQCDTPLIERQIGGVASKYIGGDGWECDVWYVKTIIV